MANWHYGSCVELWAVEWAVAVAVCAGDKYSWCGRVLAITAFYLTLTVCYTHLCSLNYLLYIVIYMGLLPKATSLTVSTLNL